VPADALEVFPSVHLIFVIQDKDGLGVGVHGVPELEGRPPTSVSPPLPALSPARRCQAMTTTTRPGRLLVPRKDRPRP
jgi:hypothetical protein